MLTILRGFVHYRSLYIVFLQVVVPLLFLFELLHWCFRGFVVPEKLTKTFLDLLLDGDHLFSGSDHFFVYSFAILDLFKLIFVEYFEFLELIDELLFLIVDKLYKLEIICNSLISQKVEHKTLIDLRVVVVDFDHEQPEC